MSQLTKEDAKERLILDSMRIMDILHAYGKRMKQPKLRRKTGLHIVRFCKAIDYMKGNNTIIVDENQKVFYVSLSIPEELWEGNKMEILDAYEMASLYIDYIRRYASRPGSLVSFYIFLRQFNPDINIRMHAFALLLDAGVIMIESDSGQFDTMVSRQRAFNLATKIFQSRTYEEEISFRKELGLLA